MDLDGNVWICLELDGFGRIAYGLSGYIFLHALGPILARQSDP